MNETALIQQNPPSIPPPHEMGARSSVNRQKLALRADSGLMLGNIYPLKSERNILGRSVDVAVPVDDSRVSRNHAAIDYHQGRILLVDLGSTNGTYLNGVRLEQVATLKVGDRVRVGSTVFVVEALDQAKQSVGKTWREPTKAIMREEVNRAPQAKDSHLKPSLGGSSEAKLQSGVESKLSGDNENNVKNNVADSLDKSASRGAWSTSRNANEDDAIRSWSRSFSDVVSRVQSLPLNMKSPRNSRLLIAAISASLIAAAVLSSFF